MRTSRDTDSERHSPGQEHPVELGGMTGRGPANLEGPARRIAVAGALVVLLLAFAIGVTLWRYGVANNKYTEALHKSQTIALVEHATDKLVDVSTTVNVLAVSPAGDELATLRHLRTEFDQPINESAQLAPSPAKVALTGQIRTAAGALFAQAERGVVSASGTPAIGAAVLSYNARLAQLETPLDALRETAKAEAAQAQASASSAADNARTIALITGFLAALVAFLVALYTTRVIGSQFKKIDDQVEH